VQRRAADLHGTGVEKAGGIDGNVHSLIQAVGAPAVTPFARQS